MKNKKQKKVSSTNEQRLLINGSFEDVIKASVNDSPKAAAQQEEPKEKKANKPKK